MAVIAFIGLGNMGRHMAGNLRSAGHELRCFDLANSNLEAASSPEERAGSVAEAVTDAQFVVSVLPDGPACKSVFSGQNGAFSHLPKGGVIVDCSTIDVATARALASEAIASGQDMLDAPMSGGVAGAEAGKLTFMVGGDAAAMAKAEPLLKAMGQTIVHAGASGAGQAAKICNNMLLGISMIGVSETFALADALGLERQKLFDISSRASGQCWSMTSYCPVPGPVPTSPANRDYAPGFAAAMMLKDLRLAADEATNSGAATPLGKHAKALYESMCEDGLGAQDFSAIFEHLLTRKSTD